MLIKKGLFLELFWLKKAAGSTFFVKGSTLSMKGSTFHGKDSTFGTKGSTSETTWANKSHGFYF